MKRQIAILLLTLSAVSVMAQKEQDPDTLVWNNRRYAITVHRDVPSILSVWYQRTMKEPPFQSWSSNNHRGHVATYEVLDNAIQLTHIKALRYRTRGSNLWSATGIDTVVTPYYFDIIPLESARAVNDDNVIADWFSGVLQLTLIPADKKEQKTDEAKGVRLLQIEKGRIVQNLFISNDDQERIAKGKTTEAMRDKLELLALQERYINFYTRIASDREGVIFKGHKGLFEHQVNSLTLYMLKYGNDPMLWPKNWNSRDDDVGAPFGEYLFWGDSLYMTALTTHSGKEPNYPPERHPQQFTPTFASWITGEYVIHYGTWETDAYGQPDYVVAKTQKIRIRNGVVTSSTFAPSSFDDDRLQMTGEEIELCDGENIYSVKDKQLAQVIGEYKQPKKNPTYKGDKALLRNWFLNKSLTDERARERLFRVRIAFMVNCRGEAGNWQIINKNKGELFEFSNMVLDIVKQMPQQWIAATDKKGNAVDCWQVIEFTISNGSLTNADYQ